MADERQTEVCGPCKKCGHGARSHSSRSGLCKIDSCQCEIFDGPGPQPWELEDRWPGERQAEPHQDEDCPDAEVCKTCPCSHEDDVCFPGERLRAEVDYWRGRVGVQIDRIDRAVTERTAAIVAWLRDEGIGADENNLAADAVERKFLAPTRTQEARCGKPIEDDCPCALDAGHDGPCWPGHSWG